MHCDLIAEEYTVWVLASGAVLNVLRDLLKACAWRGLGVVVIFVVGLGVVLCLSVDHVCFVVGVHD